VAACEHQLREGNVELKINIILLGNVLGLVAPHPELLIKSLSSFHLFPFQSKFILLSQPSFQTPLIDVLILVANLAVHLNVKEFFISNHDGCPQSKVDKHDDV
jgi:hypothetical protein